MYYTYIMSEKLHKKSKKIGYIIASLFLAVLSFGGGMFSSNPKVSEVYADVPSPSSSPCPGPGCCETCEGDNDCKL